MDPKDKTEYEESAEEEMKRYRARVYEYESRMVEEARKKASAAPGPVSDKSAGNSKALDGSSGSHKSKEMGSDSQRSEEKTDPARSAPQGVAGPSLHSMGVPLQQGYGHPAGLSYALLQPSLQALGSLPGHQFMPGNQILPGAQQLSNEAQLLQLLQAQQNQGGGIPGLGAAAGAPFGALSGVVPGPAGSTVYNDWGGQASYQEQILAALQRENILQEQLQAARAANAPVAMTIMPPGNADQQLFLQLLERDRRNQGEGTPPQFPQYPQQPPQPPR